MTTMRRILACETRKDRAETGGEGYRLGCLAEFSVEVSVPASPLTCVVSRRKKGEFAGTFQLSKILCPGLKLFKYRWQHVLGTLDNS